MAEKKKKPREMKNNPELEKLKVQNAAMRAALGYIEGALTARADLARSSNQAINEIDARMLETAQKARREQ